jgi:outer membrane lipoprotein SlyB
MQYTKTHPMVIAAAAAVLLVSLLGAAAITGLLPKATSTTGDAAVARNKDAVVQRQAPQATRCPTCGVIESVRAVEVQGDASGLGAVAGGLAGAAVGSQFGRGDGRTLMTIAGAAGGAYAGNSIEQQVKKRTVYRVSVRLEDGTVRILSQATPPPFAVGDRVRIVGATLERA